MRESKWAEVKGSEESQDEIPERVEAAPVGEEKKVSDRGARQRKSAKVGKDELKESAVLVEQEKLD